MASQRFVFGLLAYASFVFAVPRRIRPLDDCLVSAVNDRCAIIDTREFEIIAGTCQAPLVS